MKTKRVRLLAAGALVLATALVGAAARGIGRTSATSPPSGKATFAATSTGPVSFSGQLDRTAVLRGGDGVVRMELTMAAAGSATTPTRRVPTDLVIVLDRSGSMGGEKIEHARAAVRELVSQLGAQDRFALVTYANDADLAVPLAAPTDATRNAWLGTIAALRPDGGTNMAAGLDVGLGLIERGRASGRVPRLILISDGLANQGDATPDGLRRRAGRAARGEFALSTVGVGTDFNEELMTALADAGTGNYYYLAGSQDLATVFAREFDAARTTVASGLAVRVRPAAGVRVLDAAGYPLAQDADGITFFPGTLFDGQERRVWVTLAVPAHTLGDLDLGQFSLTYGAGGERVTLAFADAPRVACVASEDDFVAAIDSSSWTRSVTADAYNEMQAEVAREVKAGRRDQALQRLRQWKDETATLNARVQSAPVAARIDAAGALEREVRDAFEGADQAAKQNALSKAKVAESVDARRPGSKK